jgi:hypothetical protein
MELKLTFKSYPSSSGHRGRPGLQGGSLPGNALQDFGDVPIGGNASETFSSPWEFSVLGEGKAPAWALEARNTYVVNDDKTTKNNRLLREGGRAAAGWLKATDRLCETASFKEPSLVYRGALLRDDQIQGIIEQGGFTDEAFMSTSPRKDMAQAYANIRVRNGKRQQGHRVIFTLLVPPGVTFGRMDRTEYVMRRGSTVKVTGFRRPNKNGEWEIFGELS